MPDDPLSQLDALAAKRSGTSQVADPLAELDKKAAKRATASSMQRLGITPNKTFREAADAQAKPKPAVKSKTFQERTAAPKSELRKAIGTPSEKESAITRNEYQRALHLTSPESQHQAIQRGASPDEVKQRTHDILHGRYTMPDRVGQPQGGGPYDDLIGPKIKAGGTDTEPDKLDTAAMRGRAKHMSTKELMSGMFNAGYVPPGVPKQYRAAFRAAAADELHERSGGWSAPLSILSAIMPESPDQAVQDIGYVNPEFFTAQMLADTGVHVGKTATGQETPLEGAAGIASNLALPGALHLAGKAGEKLFERGVKSTLSILEQRTDASAVGMRGILKTSIGQALTPEEAKATAESLKASKILEHFRKRADEGFVSNTKESESTARQEAGDASKQSIKDAAKKQAKGIVKRRGALAAANVPKINPAAMQSWIRSDSGQAYMRKLATQVRDAGGTKMVGDTQFTLDDAVKPLLDQAQEPQRKPFKIGGETAGVDPAAEREKLRQEIESKHKAKIPTDVEAHPEGNRIVDGEGRPIYETRVPTQKIKVDPYFQWRQSEVTDTANQVSGRYKDVATYDEGTAGPLTVWEQRDGTLYAINGHHRLEIAKRTGHESLPVKVYRESDGITRDQARGLGALQNLRDGNGTAIDAVGVMKDLGYTVPNLKALGVSLKSDLGRNTVGMMNLPKESLGLVSSGRVSEDVAGAIGAANLSPERATGAMKVAERNPSVWKTHADGKDLADMARRQEMATKPAEAGDLFGESSQEFAWEQQQELKKSVVSNLTRDERLFKALNKGKAVGDTKVDAPAQEKAAAIQEWAIKAFRTDENLVHTVEQEAVKYAQGQTTKAEAVSAIESAAKEASQRKAGAFERGGAAVDRTERVPTRADDGGGAGGGPATAVSGQASGQGNVAAPLIDQPEDLSLKSPTGKAKPKPKKTDGQPLLAPETIGDKSGQTALEGTSAESDRGKTAAERKAELIAERDKLRSDQEKRNTKRSIRTKSGAASFDPVSDMEYAIKDAKLTFQIGFTSVQAWKDEMVKYWGEDIKPHLPELWKHAKGEMDAGKETVQASGQQGTEKETVRPSGSGQDSEVGGDGEGKGSQGQETPGARKAEKPGEKGQEKGFWQRLADKLKGKNKRVDAVMEDSPTGTSHEAMKMRERSGGPDAPDRGTKKFKTGEEAIRYGRAQIANGADPIQIVSDLERSGGMATAHDSSILRAHLEDLAKNTNKAWDAYDAAPDVSSGKKLAAKQDAVAASAAEYAWESRIKPFATEWSDIGTTYQGTTDIESGSWNALRRTFEKNYKRPATTREIGKLKRTAQRVSRAQSDLQQSTNLFGEEAVAVAKKREANAARTISERKAPTKRSFPKSGDIDAWREHFAQKFGSQSSPSRLKDKTGGAVRFGGPDMSPEEVRELWRHAGDHYFGKIDPDSGRMYSARTAAAKTADDFGLPIGDVQRAFTLPKTARKLDNDMKFKSYRARQAKRDAEDLIKPPGKVHTAIAFIAELPENWALLGHMVAMVTHAGGNIMDPVIMGKWAISTGTQFSAGLFGTPLKGMMGKGFERPSVVWEGVARDMETHRNFKLAINSGVKCDPERFDKTDNGLEYWSNLGPVGEMGKRSWIGLYRFRFETFSHFIDKVPDDMKADVAPILGEWVNAITGYAKLPLGLEEKFKDFFFAPSLEAARWKRLVGDPYTTGKHLAQYGFRKNLSGEDAAKLYMAKFRFKRMMRVMGTYGGLLAVNQAILFHAGYRKKEDLVNFEEPWKGDWLLPKWKGTTLSAGNLFGPYRLLVELGRGIYENWEQSPKEGFDRGVDALLQKHTVEPVVKTMEGKFNPLVETLSELINHRTFDGRPTPNAPEHDKKLLAAQGKTGYSWASYFLGDKAPIPFAEMYNRIRSGLLGEGVPVTTAEAITGFAFAATGFRVGESSKDPIDMGTQGMSDEAKELMRKAGYAGKPAQGAETREAMSQRVAPQNARFVEALNGFVKSDLYDPKAPPEELKRQILHIRSRFPVPAPPMLAEDAAAAGQLDLSKEAKHALDSHLINPPRIPRMDAESSKDFQKRRLETTKRVQGKLDKVMATEGFKKMIPMNQKIILKRIISAIVGASNARPKAMQERARMMEDAAERKKELAAAGR